MKYFAALRSLVRLPQTQVLHYLLYYLGLFKKAENTFLTNH
jgi:hypothetical protein